MMKSFKHFFLIHEKQYTPDRIPYKTDRAYSGKGGKKLRLATNIAYRSHQAISNDKAEEFADKGDPKERRRLRNELSGPLKDVEQKYLRMWANKQGLILDNSAFDKKWKEQGELGEAENQVYFDEDSQKWFKKNNLGYHSKYLEFFYRMSLHNEMFPEAPVELEGFVEDNGDLLPVFSQKHVKAERGATEEEVETLMTSLGYSRVGNTFDYYNSEKGIKVEDLHDENVLVGPDGMLYVIDPVIYLDDEGKMNRISSNEPLQFEL